MPTAQPLEALIHALDQTERRYFTVQAKRHVMGDKNIYLRLFEAIAAQKEPDDEVLKRIVPAAQLASQKHYLFQMILKAMRGYQSGKGVNIQMRELLQDISFLQEKGMVAHCQKLLKKAKKLGEEHDRFQDLLVLLDTERRMVKITSRDKLADELDRIEEERKLIIQKLDVQYQYIELYDRLYTLLRQQMQLDRQSALHTVRKSIQLPLLADVKTARTFRSRSYFYLCRAYCHQLLGELHDAFALYAANVAHWEGNPHWIKEEPFQYQRALSNYLSICERTKNWSPFPSTLAKMQQLSCVSIEERAEQFSNFYFYTFFHCLNNWQFEDATLLAPQIEKGLEQYGDIIPDSRLMGFIFNLMVMFFFLGKPKEALTWLFKLLNIEKTEVRQDLQRAARIYLLILHYELGNLDLYDHLFPMVQRYLKQYSINDFEQQILDFLKTLYRGGGLAWPRASALALVDALEALTQAHSDAHFPGIREAIMWLRSRTEGRGMIEIGKSS